MPVNVATWHFNIKFKWCSLKDKAYLHNSFIHGSQPGKISELEDFRLFYDIIFDVF